MAWAGASAAARAISPAGKLTATSAGAAAAAAKAAAEAAAERREAAAEKAEEDREEDWDMEPLTVGQTQVRGRVRAGWCLYVRAAEKRWRE